MSFMINSSRFGAVAPPDIYWDKTVLLLSGNGTNGSSTFLDESFVDRGAPGNGVGVVVSTTAIGQFGTGTIFFDGVNDRLYYYPSAHFFLKNYEFTVEGRFAFAAGGLAVDQTLMSQWQESGNQRGWRLVWNGSTDLLEFHLSTTGANSITILSAAFTPTPDQLYHIVAERDGNDWRLYVDGVMLDKDTNSNTQFKNQQSYFRIGSYTNGTPAETGFFNGRAEEIRITKGAARYADDAGFAPLTVAHSRSNGVFPTFAYPYTLPIRNGDAETSAGDSGTPMRHWTNVLGSMSATLASGALPEDSYAFFYAGNNSYGANYQNVAIPANAHADVDAGAVRLVCGYLQYCVTTDSQYVFAQFLDASLGSLGFYTTHGLNSDGAIGAWMSKGFNTVVPAGTRFIRFQNESDRNDGTSNDGYLDNLTARLEYIPTRSANEGPSSTRWRIMTNGLPFSDGYVRTGGATNSRFSIADLEMHDAPGSGDQCSGGTASASSQYSASFPAANAFDATLTDGWIKGSNASTDVAAEPHWLEYQFPAAVHVNSLKIRSRSSLDAGAGSGAPYNFDVEYFDGSVWQFAWRCTTEQHWKQNEQRQFDKPL